MLAQVIEGLPAVEDGQPAGGLELEKVNRGADELELGAELLPAAARSDPRELRKLGLEIRHREDPEGAARQAYRQHEKRRLRLFDHADGMLGLEGALPAPEGIEAAHLPGVTDRHPGQG